MLTFIEKLKELPPDRMVYVGMRSGAGWVAIETAETLIKKIKKLDTQVKKRTEDALFSNSDRIRALWFNVLPRYETRIAKLKEDVKSLEGLSIEIFAGGYTEKREKVAEKRKELDSAEFNYNLLKKEMGDKLNTLYELQEYLRDYVTVGERLVLESYIHTSQPMGNAFLLEGKEFGCISMAEESGGL